MSTMPPLRAPDRGPRCSSPSPSRRAQESQRLAAPVLGPRDGPARRLGPRPRQLGAVRSTPRKVYLQVKESDGQWVDIIWDDGDAGATTAATSRSAASCSRTSTTGSPPRRTTTGSRRPIEFTPGKTGVDLTLSPGRRDRRLVHPRPERVREQRHDRGAPRAPARRRRQEDLTIWHPKEDGTFRLSPLKRGKYEVRVTCDQGRDIMLEVRPVSVRDGETIDRSAPSEGRLHEAPAGA